MTEKPATPEQAVEILTAPSSPYATAREVVRGVEHTVFQHCFRNFAELYAHSALHDPRTMLVYEDERYSFAEVRARIRNLAHHLVHGLGVERGARVALAMRNFPEWCFSYAAATSIGAVIVPLNAWWTGSELRYAIEDSGARLVIVDEERLERLYPELSGLGVQIVVARAETPPPEGVLELEPLLQGDHPLPAREVGPDDDATILYTSGSSGRPKGVVSTHRAVLSAIMAWECIIIARGLLDLEQEQVDLIFGWLAQGPAALDSRPLDLPQSSMLLTLPLFHVTGCNVQFLPAFRSGRKLVLMHKWNPERALELIEREQITDFSGVPTMSWELVHSPDFEKRDTSTLRTLSAGGASRPPDHVKVLRARAAHALPGTGYGMTETNSVGTAISGDDYLARPASVGRPVPPLVELRIVDPEDRVLGTDQEGEICIKSVTNMRAYWNQSEETARVVRDGFIYTGDLGKLDAGGFLFITGRSKDIVIRGGENVSCPEVERALYEHPAVSEAAVYGVPDARLGEAIAASVRTRNDVSVMPDELRAHVASRLALFKVPAHVWLQSEPLPRLGSGKIDKRALRRSATERLGLAPKPKSGR